MPFVYSTLTATNNYHIYRKEGAQGLPVKVATVTIKGGSNIADKHLVTPQGVVTKVSDEELELLEENPDFRLHKENGFITVEGRKADVDKVVKNMKPKDASAPKTPADFEKMKKDAEKKLNK